MFKIFVSFNLSGMHDKYLGVAKRFDHYKRSTAFFFIKFPLHKFLKGLEEILKNGLVVQQTCKVKVVSRYR